MHSNADHHRKMNVLRRGLEMINQAGGKIISLSAKDGG